MADLTGGGIIPSMSKADGTRYMGGAARAETDHPMLTGNFYVYFKLPKAFTTGTDVSLDASKFLLSAAEEYTPHADAQIKVADVEGQGGIGASFITGRTHSREFTINYRDYWKAPIFNIHRRWSFINPYFGGTTASKFGAEEYKGTCMVIQTKPVVRGVAGAEAWKADDITKIAYYDGVFPKVDINAVYSATVSDNTVVKPSIQYSFDGYPLDETSYDGALKTIAAGILTDSTLFDHTNSLYTDLNAQASELGIKS